RGRRPRMRALSTRPCAKRPRSNWAIRESCERSGIAARLHFVQPRQRDLADAQSAHPRSEGWSGGCAASIPELSDERSGIHSREARGGSGGCAASIPVLSDERSGIHSREARGGLGGAPLAPP